MKVHRHTPAITDMISLPFVTEVAITPDGSHVAYIVRTADWEKNRYLFNCFVHDIDRNETRKLAEDVWHLRWLSGRMLAMLHRRKEDSERFCDKPQIWLFQDTSDRSVQVSFAPHGVKRFWLYGNGVIYCADTEKSAKAIERERQYGSYIHVGQEPRTDDLFYVSLSDILSDAEAKASPLQLTGELPSDYRIRDLCLSSDMLYLNCQFQEDFDAVSVWRLPASPTGLESLATSEAGKNSEDRENTDTMPAWKQMELPPRAAVMDVEPDGERLLLNWDGGRSKFFSNEPWALWTCLTASDGSISELYCLTEHVKRQILGARWTTKGIYIPYIDSAVIRIARLDKEGQLDAFNFGDIFPLCFSGFDITKTGAIAFTAGGPNDIPEVVVIPETEVTNTQSLRILKITTFSRLCKDWTWGTVETIRWKSRDNLEIEGVLFKPADFDPVRKYPLVVVVHGGPAYASFQLRLDYEDIWFFPTLQFLARGILVLKPNYRGSDGRGHEFLELLCGNLGTGELWDIESGVDYLIEQGYVEPTRVGCAGVSHGGFVTAFATTHSDRFAAVSTCVGVANWAIYYATSAFYSFPERMLGGLPHQLPEAYRRASPTFAIGDKKGKKTPTLIQHGDADPIVDFANAQELYRILKAEGVWVEFFQYPGMGHGMSNENPRVARAVMAQNLKWFCHHLLGRPLNWDHQDELE